MDDKSLRAIRLTDRTAIKLVREHAPKQHRSLANCAAAAIVAALGVQNATSEADTKQEKSEGGE
jgi:hypothetical protein